MNKQKANKIHNVYFYAAVKFNAAWKTHYLLSFQLTLVMMSDNKF